MAEVVAAITAQAGYLATVQTMAGLSDTDNQQMLNNAMAQISSTISAAKSLGPPWPLSGYKLNHVCVWCEDFPS